MGLSPFLKGVAGMAGFAFLLFQAKVPSSDHAVERGCWGFACPIWLRWGTRKSHFDDYFI